MAGLDGKGPNGQGPMTGRGLGFCSGSNVPGYMNSGVGRGMGRRFGRGFGFRQGFVQVQPQVITKTQEKEMLKQELEAIKAEQTEIEAQLKKLK